MVKSIKVSSKSINLIKADVCITGLFSGKALSNTQKKLDSELNGSISSAIKLSNFNAKFGKSIQVFGNDGMKRVSVFGVGEKTDFKIDNARDLGAKIINMAKSNESKTVTVDGSSFRLERETYCQAFCEGIILGAYSFNEYKSDKKEKKIIPIRVTITGNVSSNIIKKSIALGRSVCFARDISNHPANIATPTFLANHAKKIGRAKNFKIKILNFI